MNISNTAWERASLNGLHSFLIKYFRPKKFISKEWKKLNIILLHKNVRPISLSSFLSKKQKTKQKQKKTSLLQENRINASLMR